MAGSHIKWMTGYDKYYTALNNKPLLEYWDIPVGTPDGLETFKHWLNDHNEGADVGGLACFTAYLAGASFDILPDESAEAGKKILTEWGPWGGLGHHAMTFVGYNYDIKYDYNGDGLFTNDIDINEDNIVDMRDWEVGALKIANSYGTAWPYGEYADGFVYMSYKTLAEPEQITGQRVYVITLQESSTPQMTVKVKMTHSSRKKIMIRTGTSEDADSLEPSETIDYRAYAITSPTAEELPMQGITDDPIEIELDISSIVNSESKKFFLEIVDEDMNGGDTNEVISFSIVDYRYDTPLEVQCTQTPIDIEEMTTTRLSILYDVLPNIISEHTIIDHDVYIRDDTQISPSIFVSFSQNINVNIYDGRLTVNDGATLEINSDVTILNSENSNIIINDNVSLNLGPNVTFKGETIGDCGNLEINDTGITNFDETHFIYCNLINRNGKIVMSDSDFLGCYLSSKGGELHISDTTFDDETFNHHSYGIESNSDSEVELDNVTVENFGQGIRLNYTGVFTIENTISRNNYLQCLYVYNSRNRNNYIYNSEFTGSSLASGLQVYGSNLKVTSCNILQNSRGISLFNRSSLTLEKDRATDPWLLVGYYQR